MKSIFIIYNYLYLKYYIFCRNCLSKFNLLDCVAHKQKKFKLYLSSYHNWMVKDECKSGKYAWFYFSGNEASKGQKCITIHFCFFNRKFSTWKISHLGLHVSCGFSTSQSSFRWYDECIKRIIPSFKPLPNKKGFMVSADTSQQIKLLDSNYPPLSELLKQESEHQAWFDSLQEHHHICLWHR